MKYHHFEILRGEDGELWVLGQGAGGKTYKARDTQLARLVALKVVTADAFRTPEAKERFAAEARTAASLHHPNIASIYYFGEQDGDCFYAMEFVDGCTLEELVQREGVLPPAAALDIACQTAAALGVAHEAELIHRDVKPANILITESSSGARSVKLIDFGLAAGANAAAGGKAVFAGTPLFASPEQLDEVDVDARSDIYSLGAALFFMISGRPPYVGTLSQIVTQHTLQPTPVDLIPSAPAEVIALIKRYMKKDPDQRPRSGAQARAEAEAALSALRPDNQATALEWLTSHYGAVGRLRQVEGGFLYGLTETETGERAEALHLDRSAAGLQAADQYRFAVPKITELGSPCLRDPGKLVEVVDGLLVIIKDPAPSTRLLSVMRVRRILPLDEVRLILEPLARALDEAAQAGLAVPHLGLRDIELCPALEPQTRLDRWPGLTARVDLLPIAEATSINTSATIVGSSLVTSSRVVSGQGADPLSAIASLAYEMLGGMTAPGSGRYVPLAELSEAQNRQLQTTLLGVSAITSASGAVSALFQAASGGTPDPEHIEPAAAIEAPVLFQGANFKHAGSQRTNPLQETDVARSGKAGRLDALLAALLIAFAGFIGWWLAFGQPSRPPPTANNPPADRQAAKIEWREEIRDDSSKAYAWPSGSPTFTVQDRTGNPLTEMRQQVGRLAPSVNNGVDDIKGRLKAAMSGAYFSPGGGTTGWDENNAGTGGQSAMETFLERASQGDASAQNSLGDCYANGVGVAKDNAAAVRWYRKAAEQGNAAAQFNLGWCYFKGIGVTKNEAEAVSWYRKAAYQGNVLAQANLASCYESGTGVGKSEAEAVTWYRQAAEQGNADAQRNLAWCFLNGNGVARDEDEAASWFRKAADQGDPGAQSFMGACYLNGLGVTKNDAEAARWFRRAAEQGDSGAQNLLGSCYRKGIGVAKNEAEAAKWYRKAAEQGNTDAKENLSNLGY